MRVVLFIRSDARHLVGGPSAQLNRYAEAIHAAGGRAVIHDSHAEVPRGSFDIAHLSNLDWPLETARQFELAKRCARWVVISPIHRRRAWVAAFPPTRRRGLASFAARAGQEPFERLRNLYFATRAPALRREAIRQLSRGVAKTQKQVLGACDMTFVLAQGEAASLEEDFSVSVHPRALVRNGVAWSDSASTRNLPSEFVLCVGRIEAQKGQLEVARALRELGMPGLFVGDLNPRHRVYAAEFRRLVECTTGLSWLPTLSHEDVLRLYRRATLHVLASWFEVAPLVDLEAAAAGCRVVTTSHGHTREYLGDGAEYWDPASGEPGLVASLRRGLNRSLDPEFAQRVRHAFAWPRVTQDLIDAYTRLT
jgi:glycosyltransferase involved in cell wall biosynthesis